ncbi:ABC transporter permease [Actinospongicola halichondriae]|uniref:ABC transporter permease n=1 Tax=Actinospongicola halichondriae TaxID=3236844 RepID=UPI003D419A37
MPESLERIWSHRLGGPALRVLVLYVVAVEGITQFVFGRITIGWIDIGLQSSPTPRYIFVNGALIGLLYGLLGMGLILVYRANRIINFAQAQLGSVAAVLALQLILAKGVNYFLVLPIVILGSALLGAATDVLVMRRFRSAPRLIATVATIGVSLLLVFLELKVQVWISGDLITSSAFTTPWSKYDFTIGTLVFDGNFIMAGVATAVICAALAAFFRYTDMGIAVRASAENGERASMLGIPVARVSTIVWIIAGLLSGIAVFLRAPMVGLTIGSSIGPSVLLYGLAAAVLARMEKLPAAVIAGMGIGIINQSAIFATNKGNLADASMLVLILVALLVQRGALSRAFDAGVATWQSAKEYRPIPAELRSRQEVQTAKAVLAALVGVIAVVLPLLLPERFAGRFTIVVVTAMVGVSLVILTGWAGQISLGQFAFAGIGSLVAGGMAVRGFDFFLCLLAAGLAGAMAAVLVGLPALRIQGPFLAVTTLAFAFTVEKFFLSRDTFDFFLPQSGEPVARPKLYGIFSTESDVRFYFVCLTFLVLSLFVARSLRRNRLGRLLIGARDNGKAVQAYGVNLAATKLSAFAISGFIAAVGGALLAFQLRAVDAATFSPERSVSVFTITVIGGLTSLPGALLGAIYVEGVPFLFSGDETVRLLTSSVGLLILVLIVPGGLSEIAYRMRDGFLRWVADRNDIHVPSLVADSLQTVDASMAAVAVAPAPSGETIRCPACGDDIALADVTTHEHFAKQPAEEDEAVLEVLR